MNLIKRLASGLAFYTAMAGMAEAADKKTKENARPAYESMTYGGQSDFYVCTAARDDDKLKSVFITVIFRVSAQDMERDHRVRQNQEVVFGKHYQDSADELVRGALKGAGADVRAEDLRSNRVAEDAFLDRIRDRVAQAFVTDMSLPENADAVRQGPSLHRKTGRPESARGGLTVNPVVSLAGYSYACPAAP